METFTDADGMEHKIVGYCNHGTCQNFMITTIEDSGMTFPQIWESSHNQFTDELPVWAMRKINDSFTVQDILFNTMTGPVAGVNDFDWREMK